MNCSRPLSVSGCAASFLITSGGAVITSAPIRAASRTWFTLRMEAARIIKVDVIQTANEGRDEGRTCFGRDQRLVGREAESHVDHVTFARQNLTGFQPVPCQRQLDGDVVGDLRELAAFGDHRVGFQRHNFGRDGTVDEVTDFLGHFEDVAARFQDQGGVGGHAIDHAKVIEFGIGVDLGCIYEEFHGLSFRVGM